MRWEVEYTDEFGQWWVELCEQEQISVAASVQLLEQRGPNLGFLRIPRATGQRFHEDLDSDSMRIWTAIPRQSGHPLERGLAGR